MERWQPQPMRPHHCDDKGGIKTAAGPKKETTRHVATRPRLHPVYVHLCFDLYLHHKEGSGDAVQNAARGDGAAAAAGCWMFESWGESRSRGHLFW